MKLTSKRAVGNLMFSQLFVFGHLAVAQVASCRRIRACVFHRLFSTKFSNTCSKNPLRSTHQWRSQLVCILSREFEFENEFQSSSVQWPTASASGARCTWARPIVGVSSGLCFKKCRFTILFAWLKHWPNCCSSSLASSGYVSPNQMPLLDYLLRRVKPLPFSDWSY